MQTQTFRYKNPVYSPAIDAIRDSQITEVDGIVKTNGPTWIEQAIQI